MIRHQMVVVDALDGVCQRLPHLGMNVALYVATHHPDDVGRVLVSVGQETAVSLGLPGIDIASLHL